MSSKKPKPHDTNSDHQKDETTKRFSHIVQTISNRLAAEPLEHHISIHWEPSQFELKGPRFGASSYTTTDDKTIIELSEELLTNRIEFLEPVLWREAFLLHLPPIIRKVPESSDLGLYCYYRYGLRTSKKRQKFQQLWESVSPPQGYESYCYYPTAGFFIFDQSVNGKFLQMVLDWFESFKETSIHMSSHMFTADLERWIFNHHILLQPLELKILRGLNDCLNCTQKQLAEILGLRQPTVSRIIKSLAKKHLLRFFVYENYPVLGLLPITVQFSSSNLGVINSIKKIATKTRYTLIIQEFSDSIFISFAIPKERISRLRQWIKQVAARYDISAPKIFFTIERVNSKNFEIYNPESGWPNDYETILENIFRIIKEEWTHHIPPLNVFKYSSSRSTKSIELQPQDFVYMQRATDAFLVTGKARFYEAHEARKAGYRESEHMTYRRRIEFLKQHNIMSKPMGIAIMHIGLNDVVNIFLETPYDETKAIISAFQLLPSVGGRIYDNGSGGIMILLPSGNAVPTQTSLRDFFGELGYPIKIAVKPAWKSFGWVTDNPIIPNNYDFDKGKWIWTKDTLPTPSSDD
ncbi:MAG: MarR family transcriptional regulator [Candidatus Hermodarchaeota archaeon]